MDEGVEAAGSAATAIDTMTDAVDKTPLQQVPEASAPVGMEGAGDAAVGAGNGLGPEEVAAQAEQEKGRVVEDVVKETELPKKVEFGRDTAPARQSLLAANVPPEILQQILLLIDSETFASATLVCRRWRDATENPKLYAYHLSRSPFYSKKNSVITGPFDDSSLIALKKTFIKEAKRCLYIPFLRPTVTTVNLISESPLSSFAAGPGGEKFEFIFSQYARWGLAITSSRIYVLDLTGGYKPPREAGKNTEQLPERELAENADGEEENHEAKTPLETAVEEGQPIAPVTQTKAHVEAEQAVRVTQELKLVRRPLGADILPDGSVMAVLSSDHKISLYNMHGEKVTLRCTVDLDNPPYAIAMSPGGEILAAAFDGGIELVSLREGASPSERRTVKCHRVDKLMFSSDGSMLLGTTQAKEPATVVLTAPYFSPVEFDLTPSELVNSMWTQQILFPSTSRDCSHSTLLPRSSDQDSNWTLTYDRTYESFRAVRTDDLRNGTTYFTGPQTGADRRVAFPKDALVPSALPSTTARGDMVAAGFKGSEVWMYGVPEDLDAGPSAPIIPGADGQGIATENHEQSNDQEENEMPPRWQVLVDKYRNVFSRGKKVADVAGLATLGWHLPPGATTDPTVQRISERLFVAAPGGVGPDITLAEQMPVDGGRLVVLDFGLSPSGGEPKEITIELGRLDPQLLEEQKMDMEVEIARVRRRTMAQRDPTRVHSVIDALRPDTGLDDLPAIPEMPGAQGFRQAAPNTSIAASDINIAAPEAPDVSDDEDDEPGVTLEEAAQFAEGPYSNVNPRSRTALYRSATISAASRQRPLQPRQPHMPQYQFRRTDGTEVPDESDADNWVPPPPPYQRDAGEQLPDDLVQRALLYSGIAPIPGRSASVNTDTRSMRRRSSVDVDILAHHLRPSIQDEPLFRPESSSAVSSTNVTPRSSIRRPRTMLTNVAPNSVALRESTLTRPGSHLARSSSLGSGSPRISRSASLRQSAASGVPSATPAPVTAASVAQAPAHSPLAEQPRWSLPTPQEQPEPISPPDEVEEELQITPPSVEDGPSQAMPSDAPVPISPTDDKIVHFPENGEEDISPRALSPPDLPVALPFDAPEVVDPREAPTQIGAPPVSPLALQHTRLQHGDDLATNAPQTTFSPDIPLAPQPGPSIQDKSLPPSPRPAFADQLAPEIPEIPEMSSLPPKEIAAPVPQPQFTMPNAQEPVPEHVPEPSAYQLANLGNRPRPHIRQLSGSAQHPQMRAPSPNSYATAYSGSMPRLDSSSDQQPQQTQPDSVSIKSSSRRRLSQRIRGAFRRTEPEEPVPDLPVIPAMHAAAAQPQPLQGAARHSRMYAGARNNSSEPALHLRRPEAQRLNTIDSVGSALGRVPSVRATAQAPEPAAGPMHGGPGLEGVTALPQPPHTQQVLQPQQQPKPSRATSIFGGRRRSQMGTTIVRNDSLPPPMPPMPSGVVPPQQAGYPAQHQQPPVPGVIGRAATAEPYGEMHVYTEITAGSGGKKRRRGGRDGKCAVM